MPRYALKVEYHGAPFAGWQRQKDQPSVQGAIEEALSRIAPGRRFRRIKGSARQDPITNDGSAVGASLTLGPKDGLFLQQIK